MKKLLIYICILLRFKILFLCEKMKDSFCMYGMWQGTAKWLAKTINAEEKQSVAYKSAEMCIWQNKLKTGVTRPM